VDKRIIDEVSRRLADEGKLIELGWYSLRQKAVPADAPEVLTDEMRMAFFAGAQHVFASIMGILEPGAEPTDADMRRLSLTAKELQEFEDELKRFIVSGIRNPGN
jgi:hypothetical protein